MLSALGLALVLAVISVLGHSAWLGGPTAHRTFVNAVFSALVELGWVSSAVWSTRWTDWVSRAVQWPGMHGSTIEILLWSVVRPCNKPLSVGSEWVTGMRLTIQLNTALFIVVVYWAPKIFKSMPLLDENLRILLRYGARCVGHELWCARCVSPNLR